MAWWLNRAKGRAPHIPSQTDTVVRFVQEYVALFWHLFHACNKPATKATTRNCVPQGMVRGVRCYSGVCFMYVINPPRRLLHETVFLRGWLEECGALLGFALFG